MTILIASLNIFLREVRKSVFPQLGVPRADVIRPLLLVLVVLGRWGVVLVVVAPLIHA